MYEDILRERGVAIERVELDAGEPLPDWRAFDAIIAMGGPMSVNDDQTLSWLAAEKRLIGDAVHAGTPYWGVCLGVQLLAASLGARVYPGDQPEVGLLPVSLTASALTDPIFTGLPPRFLTMQWHGETFDLPDGAQRLAASPGYPNQSFRWKTAYGMQFHLEISPDMVREWGAVPAYAEALERIMGPGSMERLIRDVELRAEELRSHGRHIFERWLDLVAAGLSSPGIIAGYAGD